MTFGPRHVRRVVTDRLQLRQFSADDAELLERAFSDPALALWNPGRGTGRDAVLEWLESRNDWADGSHVSWAVADRDETLVGSVSVFGIDTDQAVAEIGYWIAPWARRLGLASAAVGAATEVAFADLGLHRIRLHHAVDNVASCAVAARTGYRLEGVLRQSYRYADGRHHDEHLHARLATDPVQAS
jgi:RimJ/RimL family protein N-acetyltransferase